MRVLVPLLLLAGCSAEPGPAPRGGDALYAGAGRDRLCLKGERAGLVTYGQGDSNCSARGRIEHSGEAAALLPDGDSDCRIPLTLAAGKAVLGPMTPACAYYCGPGADFSGKTLAAAPGASPAVDFAGDPLC